MLRSPCFEFGRFATFYALSAPSCSCLCLGPSNWRKRCACRAVRARARMSAYNGAQAHAHVGV
eukprot:2142518-Pleurochrysis_carterae.AAC.1